MHKVRLAITAFAQFTKTMTAVLADLGKFGRPFFAFAAFQQRHF
jgi:hypothetical protein